MKRCFVLHCRLQQDVDAEVNFRNQGHEAFCPLARRRSSHLSLEIETPLPHYFFQQFDDTASDWTSIGPTQAVRHLAYRTRPSPVAAPQSLACDIPSGSYTNIIEQVKALIFSLTRPFPLSRTPFANLGIVCLIQDSPLSLIVPKPNNTFAAIECSHIWLVLYYLSLQSRS